MLCVSLWHYRELGALIPNYLILFRGELALALALGLPPELPGQSQIVITAFGVVTFSIFVQGLTVPFLLNKLNTPD